MSSVVRRLSLWVPPAIYMAVIFGFSTQSQPLPQVTAVVWDKLLHFLEYGGLAVLVYRAIAGEGANRIAAFALTVLLASAYGASDEWHQSFVPMRDSDIHDWYADTAGGALGAACGTAISTLLRQQRRLRPTPPGQSGRPTG